jgi:Fe-S cluster assembly iron-binding protein IscA
LELTTRRAGWPPADGPAAPNDEHKQTRRDTILTITENAATEIRNLIDLPQAPDGAGVRIANDPAEDALTLSLAAMPAEDDTVLDSDGARVFLDARATTLLDDKMLDAVKDPSGDVQFAIDEQSA